MLWKDQQQGVAVPLGAATVKITFHCKNTGHETVHILSVKPSCGCTIVRQGSSEVVAGGYGSIQLEFNPEGYTGSVKKEIAVQTSDLSDPLVVLSFTADIRTPILLSPRVLSWQLNDPLSVKQIVVKLDPALSNSIVSVQPESASIIYHLRKIDGCHYVLLVNPNNTNTQLVQAMSVHAISSNGFQPGMTGYVVVKSRLNQSVNLN